MSESFYSPISDPQEIQKLTDELPLALDPKKLERFVLGFPRRYLLNTPRSEIVKHFLLLESLGQGRVISSISQEEGDLWRLLLITRDQQELFSRIAGSLSCFGAEIVSAEAFANQRSLVLDSFYFRDREDHFVEPIEKDRFQHFLEEVLADRVDLEKVLCEQTDAACFNDRDLDVSLDNETHPTLTRLRIRCSDHFGLLYRISRLIALCGYSIEMAYIRTVEQQAQDEFYLSDDGRPLSVEQQRNLHERLVSAARQDSMAQFSG